MLSIKLSEEGAAFRLYAMKKVDKIRMCRKG